MSSDDDVPAPSPSAAVLARRASREAKSMREESGSEEDSDEPVEWEGDDEVSSEEDGSEDEVRVSNAQRGRVRLHWASQSSTGLEVDDERRKNTDTPRPVTTNTPTRHSPKLQIRPLTGPNCNANISTEARRWRWWSRRWRRGLR